MPIDVSGGAGSVDACLDDLLLQAAVTDRIGESVAGRGCLVLEAAADPAVLSAMSLCPAEGLAAELALAAAAAGPDGLITTGTALRATAILARRAAAAYREADARAAQAVDAAWATGGFAVGAALPQAALWAGPPLAVAVSMAPQWWAGQVQKAAFDQPWLMDTLARSAPGLVQGTAFGLAAGVGSASGPAGSAGSVLGLRALSGGRWPTADYEDAVGGLLVVGRRFGMLQDSGRFEVVAEPRPPAAVPRPAVPHTVRDVFEGATSLGQQGAARIQITAVRAADHATAYIVYIPGTQDWHPERSDSPLDLTTNLVLMAGDASILQAKVAEAMRLARIPAGAPVMLAGHSQGGIAAAALASDPVFRGEFHVTSVMTGGAPVARFPVPEGISVLSLEHDQDPVPMLEGRENPARSNWVTVERSIAASEVTGRGEPVSPLAAHGTYAYQDTAALVDSSTDPEIEVWRQRNHVFFAGTSAEVRTYSIQPVPLPQADT